MLHYRRHVFRLVEESPSPSRHQPCKQKYRSRFASSSQNLRRRTAQYAKLQTRCAIPLSHTGRDELKKTKALSVQWKGWRERQVRCQGISKPQTWQIKPRDLEPQPCYAQLRCISGETALISRHLSVWFRAICRKELQGICGGRDWHASLSCWNVGWSHHMNK